MPLSPEKRPRCSQPGPPRPSRLSCRQSILLLLLLYHSTKPVAAGVTARTPVTRRKVGPGQPAYKEALNDLLALCREADRTVAGCVPRLRLEQWLQMRCKALLADISGAALMDLLDRHTYGRCAHCCACAGWPGPGHALFKHCF